MLVIGQRINPSGRPSFCAELARGSLATVLREALEQARAGADALDVNVGEGAKDEATTLIRAVSAIRRRLDLPLWLDSRHPAVLKAALESARAGDVLNSINATAFSLKLLPLAALRSVGVVVQPSGGVLRARMVSALRIISAGRRAGIPLERFWVDCLAMPFVSGAEANRIALDMIPTLRKAGLKSLLALSNVSFSMAGRGKVEAAFLKEAGRRGLDACILDPLRREVRAVTNSPLFSHGLPARGPAQSR